MNIVPNDSRIIVLSCTEISFVISFFNFEKFGVKPRILFFLLTLYKVIHFGFPENLIQLDKFVRDSGHKWVTLASWH